MNAFKMIYATLCQIGEKMNLLRLLIGHSDIPSRQDTQWTTYQSPKRDMRYTNH